MNYFTPLPHGGCRILIFFLAGRTKFFFKFRIFFHNIYIYTRKVPVLRTETMEFIYIYVDIDIYIYIDMYKDIYV